MQPSLGSHPLPLALMRPYLINNAHQSCTSPSMEDTAAFRKHVDREVRVTREMASHSCTNFGPISSTLCFAHCPDHCNTSKIARERRSVFVENSYTSYARYNVPQQSPSLIASLGISQQNAKQQISGNSNNKPAQAKQKNYHDIFHAWCYEPRNASCISFSKTFSTCLRPASSHASNHSNTDGARPLVCLRFLESLFIGETVPQSASSSHHP